MNPKINLTSLFYFFLVLSAFSQSQRDPVELTFGAEFRALVPVSFFNVDSVVLGTSNATVDSNYSATARYTGGFGFGGVLRAKLTPFWNIETGLYYTRRTYEYDISDNIGPFSDVASVRSIGYEIPLKALVYIQMADKVFANVALGVSADFFASDVEVRHPDYVAIIFKRQFARFAALGNIGVEYRTDSDGYFYIGATIHQVFGNPMFAQMIYLRDGVPPGYVRTGNVDLGYFSVDFRYFFPPKKQERSKVRRTIPDWKNM